VRLDFALDRPSTSLHRREIFVSSIPADLRYTAEHEYLKSTGDDNVVQVGITDYAQGELGDVVFVELPKVGDKLKAHDVFGTIEAVKAVSELYSPVAGEVAEINSRLDGEPALVNSDPYGDGWMIKLRLANTKDRDGLMDAAAYKSHVGE
jgi:glycine cleavage system H protein